eukprot:5011791-Amphidinium_carterae.1
MACRAPGILSNAASKEALSTQPRSTRSGSFLRAESADLKPPTNAWPSAFRASSFVEAWGRKAAIFVSPGSTRPCVAAKRSEVAASH